MKVLSIYNFENGLWKRNDDTAEVGIYTKYYKPVNNLCQINADCEETECCAPWPDTYNKRCISRDLHGLPYSMRPFEDFTPICVLDSYTGDVVPMSAEEDLSEAAQAIAAEQLQEFHTLVDNTLRLNADYEGMSFYEQEAWDEARAEEIAQRDHADNSDREFAGYNDMSDESKTIYDAEFLKFKKEWFEACEEAAHSIECRHGRELRAACEVVRKAENYYDQGVDVRALLDRLYAEDQRKEVAALTALWVANNKPAAGLIGSSCSSDNKCLGQNMCCGTATP